MFYNACNPSNDHRVLTALIMYINFSLWPQIISNDDLIVEMSILQHVSKDWNPKQRHRDKREIRSGDQSNNKD
jgi:hypothetical protein